MDKERDSLYDDVLNAEDDTDAFDDFETDSDEGFADEDTDENGFEDEYEGEDADTEEAYADGEDAGSEEADNEGTDTEEAYNGEDPDDPDDTGYFMHLFEFLEQTLKSGTNVPLTQRRVVDTERCFTILNDMKQNLPDAIQYGWKIYAERDRILDKAESFAKQKAASATARANAIVSEANSKADAIVDSATRRAKAIVADAEERANAMLEDAEQRAKRMVNESEIMQRAKSEAAIIIGNARAEANERRLKAVKDGYRLLDSLEKQASGIANALNKRKNEMVGGDRQ